MTGRRTPARRLAGAAAGLALLLLAGLGPGAATAAAAAPDGASISYVEPTDEGLQVLVSVPAGAELDLDTVAATVAGVDAEATARPTEEDATVRRTTVLAIDTSNSMEGERFEAARAAAETFLDTAPADVEVGIVTFAADVDVALAPTADRDAAREVLGGLELSQRTRLYDGVQEAISAAGDEGQRKVLVLSDGADTSDTSLEDLAARVTASEVLLDVVALDQKPRLLAPLEALAEAGQGSVISADPAALREAFAAEADELARQVLVTLAVPEGVTGSEASVAVTLGSSDGELRAEAYAPVRSAQDAQGPATDLAVATQQAALSLPSWAMYAGVAAVGLGILGVMLLLVPRRPEPPSAEERIAQYAAPAGSGSTPGKGRPDAEDALASAKDVAGAVLKRNRPLEERIAKRLEGAGSSFKTAEWALLQLGVFLLSGLVGLVVGGGNLVVGLLFMVLGAVGPWVWLGVKKSQRFKAFNAALPDTLSLMSGSLAAGLSLAQSVDTIVREGSEPVAGEFKRVLVETRLGVPLEDALEGITERFDSDDFAWVVMAIRIQRQVGGNLAELLDTVAGTMRERDYLRRQVRTLSAEGRLSAYVLGGLPPFFLLYLFLTQRDYVLPLFTEPMGWVMLAGAGILLGSGSLWMKKAVSVEV